MPLIVRRKNFTISTKKDSINFPLKKMKEKTKNSKDIQVNDIGI